MLSSILISILLIIPESFAWHSNRRDDSRKNENIYGPSSSDSSDSSDDVSSDDNDLICPFITEGTPVSGNDPDVPDVDTYNEILSGLDDVEFINSVFQDIVDFLTDSQECWPADTLGGQTNYGGLFIRLAWHCAGVFRATDGAGGCAGGRQRYPPEASWDDNTNLDKARALLFPIKEKYGDALRYILILILIFFTVQVVYISQLLRMNKQPVHVLYHPTL